ncbi:hypothetical protein PS662_01617 [Pseudomonas fluorescens]|uniref:DUF2790 domain-containing protein n=1 Tax=Pseudomonas fluorescens TaxID=294 RepID=A0A5E6RHN8_PSEFL|nr:DUF2790 domain-containing protein [Pseudomonas fluorescens]VVM67302.1 hypothetical protein PS662_01617 [Pseudomonas fluorescens]
MKKIMFGFAAFLFIGSASADTPPATPIIHDQAGFFMHLDIAKVLFSTDISQECGIIPARLNYLDHQGREHVLDYQVQGSGCTNQS